MKKTIQTKNRLTAVVLILGMCLCVAFTPVHAGNICERAFTKCLVDAAIALILTGPQAAAAFAFGCVNGYIWCLKYYVDFGK